MEEQLLFSLTLATPGFGHWLEHLSRNIQYFTMQPLTVCHLHSDTDTETVSLCDTETSKRARRLKLEPLALPQRLCGGRRGWKAFHMPALAPQTVQRFGSLYYK